MLLGHSPIFVQTASHCCTDSHPFLSNQLFLYRQSLLLLMLCFLVWASTRDETSLLPIWSDDEQEDRWLTKYLTCTNSLHAPHSIAEQALMSFLTSFNLAYLSSRCLYWSSCCCMALDICLLASISSLKSFELLPSLSSFA